MYPFIFYNDNIRGTLSRDSVGPTWSTASPPWVKANQTILCLFVYMQDCFFFLSPFLFLFSERTEAAQKKHQTEKWQRRRGEQWWVTATSQCHISRCWFANASWFWCPASIFDSSFSASLSNNTNNKIDKNPRRLYFAAQESRLTGGCFLIHARFSNSSSQRGVALPTNPIISHSFSKPSGVILEVSQSEKRLRKWDTLSVTSLTDKKEDSTHPLVLMIAYCAKMGVLGINGACVRAMKVCKGWLKTSNAKTVFLQVKKKT